jgi:signal transduction histidine kinase
MTSEASTNPTIRSDTTGTPWRWWGLAAGLLSGVLDAVVLRSFGITFEINGRDAFWLVAAYLGPTFALLGYLFGKLVESSRRERATAALVHSQMETINQVRARLIQSEKLAALGQLATTIAHEVRNPLGVMRSSAQELAETIPPTNHDGRQASSFILTEIDRLNNVISSLLAFARPPHLERTTVSLAALFDQAELLAGDELRAKRVELIKSLDTTAPTIQADPDLMSQVLLGLISNSVQAVGNGGHIELTTRQRGNTVELSVSDSGPGVPLDQRTQIFEPFFTTRAKGTGLGLPVARQIVEAHGGRLTVDEAGGGGARFTIVLPPEHTALAA